MKGFIIALLMLTSAVVFTVIISVYGYKASEKLLSNAELAYSSSAENRIERTSELLSLWKKYRPILSLSLHKNEIEFIDMLLFSISESADFGRDELLYKNLCRQLTEHCKHIRELHTVSTDGIF